MWRLLRVSWAAVLVSAFLGTGRAAGQQQPLNPRDHVSQVDARSTITRTVGRINGIVGMTSQPSSIPGTQFFQVLFLQPVDHDRPERGTFVQRATLLHRSETAPMVLLLSGYDIPTSSPFQSELTSLLQANQLFVEHRFFGASVPAGPMSWSDLTIAQSAADHHALVAAFKSVYRGRWISTGRSKGGMASVYHRFFYPDDVDATVAYVAPSIHGVADDRYFEFLDQVGTEACRQALVALQRSALMRRTELVLLFTPVQDFGIFPPDKALELGVLDLPFVYWQYATTHAPCESIPAPDAPATQIYSFLDGVLFFSNYGDETLTAYSAFYYQAATELGYPAVDDRRLLDLLLFPGRFGIASFPPLLVPKTFDSEVMPRIEAWVLAEGARLLFLYGEIDPWSHTRFAVSAGNDSYRYVVPGPQGDHTAAIVHLSETDRSAVLAKLGQWMGVSIAPSIAAAITEDPLVEFSDPRRRRPPEPLPPD